MSVKIQTLVQITREHILALHRQHQVQVKRKADEVLALYTWASANKHALEAFYLLLNGKYMEACARLSHGLSIRILYCNLHEHWRDTIVYELTILSYLALTVNHAELFYQTVVCLEKIFNSAKILDPTIIKSGIRWLHCHKHFTKARRLSKLVFGRSRILF